MAARFLLKLSLFSNHAGFLSLLREMYHTLSRMRKKIDIKGSQFLPQEEVMKEALAFLGFLQHHTAARTSPVPRTLESIQESHLQLLGNLGTIKLFWPSFLFAGGGAEISSHYSERKTISLF